MWELFLNQWPLIVLSFFLIIITLFRQGLKEATVIAYGALISLLGIAVMFIFPTVELLILGSVIAFITGVLIFILGFRIFLIARKA